MKLEGITDVILESLPSKNYSQMNDTQRKELFSYVDNPEAGQYTSEALALQQIKRLRRSRSPGVDLFAPSRLITTALTLFPSNRF